MPEEADSYDLTRATLPVGTVLRGKYRIEGVIGSGGMAVVYAATHRNRKRFAVKMLHPELSNRGDIRARFVREGYLANSVEHPGVVSVLDDDVTEDGSAFLVMELLEGATVEAFAPRSRPLPLRESLSIAYDLLGVLDAAHEKGVVHRDIKPGNIFVTRQGQVKVLDFGIARLRDATLGGNATGTGAALGTPAFMAPEQALALPNEIDARTDLWAVGATLFTMLSGQLVHAGNSARQVMIRAATEPARSLASVAPDLPAVVIDWVTQALSFDKSARWESAGAMREAVAQIQHQLFGPLEQGCAKRLFELCAPDLETAPTELSPAGALQSAVRKSSKTTLESFQGIADADLPPMIAARYLPIRLIGKGGMGAVYEVEHARTGERLALKVLLSGVGASTQALERFKREARASARIKSEHVVRVTDADVAPELGGVPFLVMELLHGQDLEQVVASASGAAAPTIVVEWLRQVARALDKAHQLGIVHRDLKPENLFLAQSEDGPAIVKILDFGIVKMAEEGTAATGSGQILGTLKYMAPEQAVANVRVTPAADRCALGLVAYRLLVGESYYQGGAMIILGQLLHGELDLPSERGSRLGAKFDAWFLIACHRDPLERFASASSQVEALAAALGLPVFTNGAALESTSEPSHPRSRRTAFALLAVVGFAAMLLAGMLMNRQRTIDVATALPTASIAVAAASASSPAAAPLASPPTASAPQPLPSQAPAASTKSLAAIPDAAPAKLRQPQRTAADAPNVAVARAPKATPTETPTAPPDPYAEQK